jgi:hypothetical protein
MGWLFDLFSGYSVEEILRVNSLVLMTALTLTACFVVGAESTTPVRAPSKNML